MKTHFRGGNHMSRFQCGMRKHTGSTLGKLLRWGWGNPASFNPAKTQFVQPGHCHGRGFRCLIVLGGQFNEEGSLHILKPKQNKIKQVQFTGYQEIVNCDMGRNTLTSIIFVSFTKLLLQLLKGKHMSSQY